MTQQGKCDICRQRKVKCDERHPQCSQCAKKSRPCTYNHKKASKLASQWSEREQQADTGFPPIAPRFHSRDEDDAYQPGIDFEGHQASEAINSSELMLYVRSVNSVGEGEGVMHTFNTRRGYKGTKSGASSPTYQLPHRSTVPRSPTSALDAVRENLVEVIGPKGGWDPSFLWGAWVASIPNRLGTNRALDDASKCFVAGSIAHQNTSDYNVTVARKSYSKALRSLRDVLNGPDDDAKMSIETLAATKMLLALEKFLGIDGNCWMPHSRGLVNLIVARGPRAIANEMSWSLLYSTLAHDFIEAALSGTDSAFDSPEWLSLPSPGYMTENSSLSTAYRVIQQQMIRIPRLIRLVRKAQSDPGDISAVQDAVTLAEKLYLSNLDTMIIRILDENAMYVPTGDARLAVYYPESMDFATFGVFEMVIRYCSCRILIIGLCKALEEAYQVYPAMMPSTMLDAEEVQNASLIVMSTQFAENKSIPLSLGTLLVAPPLQIAFGTWWRIAHNGELPEGRAQYMKGWCRDKGNEMLRIWNGKEKSEFSLEVQTSTLQGGPLSN